MRCKDRPGGEDRFTDPVVQVFWLWREHFDPPNGTTSMKLIFCSVF